MKILYYDCFSGISGDMHLGAMLDAGVPPDHLMEALNTLPVKDFELKIARDQRRGIEGTRVDVILKNPEKHQKHRGLNDIKNILDDSGLSDPVRRRTLRIFRILAKAEAKVHGMPVEKVHFHEVGALDSIVDITGAAICLEYLAPDRIYCGPVELGGGMVRCAHGLLPVPAPATAEILKNIPVRTGTVGHEATTPTGAAILAANVDEFVHSLHFTPGRIAYGVGQRDADIPNVLRIFVAGTEENRDSSRVMIECNIDDMNPELYGPVMETLFEEGADDVFLTSVTMKKNRPATMISVLCTSSLRPKLTETLLSHTTTIGIRYYPVGRETMERKLETVATSLGEVTVKKAWLHGKLLKWKVEFEDCKDLAKQNGLSVWEAYRIIDSELSTRMAGKPDPS